MQTEKLAIPDKDRSVERGSYIIQKQDLKDHYNNSLCCLPRISYNGSSENLVFHHWNYYPLIISIVIPHQLVSVVLLLGEIASWSL